MIDSNWNFQNWITGNQSDGFVYVGCSAFQKVLDGKYWANTLGPSLISNLIYSFPAIQQWGIKDARF